MSQHTAGYWQKLGVSALTEMQLAYLKESTAYSLLLSNTGSGKTLAFVLKLIAYLEESDWKKQVLIVSPTRELAIQLRDVIKKMQLPVQQVLCYGGHSFRDEKAQLAEAPEIVIGTPGRLVDHFERETPGLKKFQALIIDEYDKTLELGFYEQLNLLLEYAGKLEHIQLISATEIDKLPRFLDQFQFQSFDYRSEEKPELEYFGVQAQENDKLKALALLLTTMDFSPKIIFCTHREAAERISKHLNEYGKENVVFHGGLDQAERERALIKFKFSAVDCLLATDLAARGLDIPEIESVIHYQYPQTLADFTHRNGRTARMRKTGKIYLLHAENEPLPDYIDRSTVKKVQLPDTFVDYLQGEWTTLYLNVGRKQKIRKADIIGALTQELKIPFEEIGQLTVLDEYSYLSIHKKTYVKLKNELSRIRIKKMFAKTNLCR